MDTAPHTISYTLPQYHLRQPLPQELSDNSPSSRYSPPGRTLGLEFSAAHTKRATSPAAQAQRSTWLMGRRRMGRRSGHPHPPYPPPPTSHDACNSSPAGPPPGGGGGKLCKKENSRVHSRAGKSLVPNPFPSTPRRLTLGARGRRSVRARLCAPNSARRGRGKEGAGLQPPHRPPPALRPDSMLAAPPAPGTRTAPAGVPAAPRLAPESRRAQTFSASPAPRAPQPWPARE